MIQVAVAGAGDWGRNHVRVLAGLPGAKLTWIVDPDPDRRVAAREMAPKAKVVGEISEALADDRLDAVVVASPAPTHGRVARAALAAGKHVLVEKPLAPTSREARDLVRRAARADRLLGVGHLLLHHAAVQRMRALIGQGRIGDLRYVHCQRTNLGRVRPEEGALMSLAPHDVSVMVHLIGAWPVGVAARGAVVAQPQFEDLVFLVLRFPGGLLGHVHLSWLDHLKMRQISAVGSKAMMVFDDMASQDEKLRLVRPLAGRVGAARRVDPVRIASREPLGAELRAFVKSVRTGEPFVTPAIDGARVVQVLEGAQRSLAQHGAEVPLRIR